MRSYIYIYIYIVAQRKNDLEQRWQHDELRGYVVGLTEYITIRLLNCAIDTSEFSMYYSNLGSIERFVMIRSFQSIPVPTLNGWK